MRQERGSLPASPNDVSPMTPQRLSATNKEYDERKTCMRKRLQPESNGNRAYCTGTKEREWPKELTRSRPKNDSVRLPKQPAGETRFLRFSEGSSAYKTQRRPRAGYERDPERRFFRPVRLIIMQFSSHAVTCGIQRAARIHYSTRRDALVTQTVRILLFCWRSVSCL